MREIKFRAWNKKNEKMIDYFPVLFLDYKQPRISLDDPDSNNYQIDGVLSDIDLIQYTGLKDKNGKEIYEGDILKSGDKEIGVVLWEQETTAYVLSQSDDIGDNYWSGGLQDGEWEVIGNIYENPELLNK